MKRVRHLIIIFLAVAVLAGGLAYFRKSSTPNTMSPQAQVVYDFYKDYIESKKYQGNELEIPRAFFSKSFNELIDQDLKVCEEKAAGDICGWGTDGDPFLAAQDFDPNLKLETAQLRVQDFSPTVVEVAFNVFPSAQDSTNYYDRKIKFLMVEENGQWVVDDIIYVFPDKEASTRTDLIEEMSHFSGASESPDQE